jgi:hypothetical protein
MVPRIPILIPASVEWRDEGYQAVVTDLGLGGLFLQHGAGLGVEEHGLLVLRYAIPPSANVTQEVKVMRKNEQGCGASFVNMEADASRALWRFISRTLTEEPPAPCPFCGETPGKEVSLCSRCSCRLDFESPGYFDYLERMWLYKRLEAEMDQLQPAQMQGLILFGLASFLVDRERP